MATKVKVITAVPSDVDTYAELAGTNLGVIGVDVNGVGDLVCELSAQGGVVTIPIPAAGFYAYDVTKIKAGTTALPIVVRYGRVR